MQDRNFQELLNGRFALGRHVCVGLDDPDRVRMMKVVDDTHDLALAFKLNPRRWARIGYEATREMHHVIGHARRVAPEVPFIFDGKYVDVRHTNEDSADEAFNFFGVDAVTVVVNPHAGARPLRPFLERADKGVFIVCLNSDETGTPIDNVFVQRRGIHTPYYLHLAERVATEWNTLGNCGLVVGATYPTELRLVRHIVGDMPILVPGIGAQGGKIPAVMEAGGERTIPHIGRLIGDAESSREAVMLVTDITQGILKER